MLASSEPLLWHLVCASEKVVISFVSAQYSLPNCLCHPLLHTPMTLVTTAATHSFMHAFIHICLLKYTNVLCKWKCSCSSHFAFVFNVALWEHYHVHCLNKLASAYVKCIKMLFGFYKYSSVTSMLLLLGLPTFDTVLYNARIRLVNSLQLLYNNVVAVSRKS